MSFCCIIIFIIALILNWISNCAVWMNNLSHRIEFSIFRFHFAVLQWFSFLIFENSRKNSIQIVVMMMMILMMIAHYIKGSRVGHNFVEKKKHPHNSTWRWWDKSRKLLEMNYVQTLLRDFHERVWDEIFSSEIFMKIPNTLLPSIWHQITLTMKLREYSNGVDITHEWQLRYE